ncbi:hypothetical protein LCM10_00965 [Rossellomorea aquimaris]|uniref:hypothetical protein n=1 Tax=Rossellomorea aquimaris TaxID=189382 RepID=UPI001CD33459|nr:hypothetical protein [Rossellomorea aquimaris]MCA1053538.1 hypothetical protein [Rossellomorea aquimaris]
MTTFLFFISFLLNIVCLFAVIILYTRQNRFIDLEKKQGRMLQEMEETISTYLLEMKEENERFIRSMKDSRETGTGSADETHFHATTEPDEGKAPVALSTKRLNASKAYKRPPLTEDPQDQDTGWIPVMPDDREHSEAETLLHQVQNMKESGFTLEEIAQKLGKGKTEIELLLKFNRK